MGQWRQRVARQEAEKRTFQAKAASHTGDSPLRERERLERQILEISGQERKIEAFVELMRPFGIRELVRTGRIAMVRSNATSHEDRRSPTGRTFEATPSDFA